MVTRFDLKRTNQTVYLPSNDLSFGAVPSYFMMASVGLTLSPPGLRQQSYLASPALLAPLLLFIEDISGVSFYGFHRRDKWGESRHSD